MIELEKKSVSKLLKIHAAIGAELRMRKIIRTQNNPVGDLAESLFCQTFRWTIAPNSAAGHDATDTDGQRIQIKGRRLANPSSSRQTSALRNLDQNPFDLLAGVLFKSDYSILKALLVPITLVQTQSTFSQHTNSHIFYGAVPDN